MAPPTPASLADVSSDDHASASQFLESIWDDVSLHLSPSSTLSPTHVTLPNSGSPTSPDSWRLANAVHMELQENAKLPTFNMTIDRTGGAMDHFQMPPSDTTVNLMETFLNNESRRGRRHANFGSVNLPKSIPDPTPLIEMKDPPILLPFAESTQQQQQANNETQSYIPRHVPLPIPNIQNPSVLATAAALANTMNQPNKNKKSADNKDSKPAPSLSKPAATDNYALPAQKKPNLEMATTQQSQYGFGKKHQVPAVPANNQQSKKPPRKRSLPVAETNNNLDAYERKKQRAKDARVKLNESIDRLSLSINMAGSQSKVRLTQLQELAPKHIFGRHSKFETTQSILERCVQTAEDAKKWDRPSFVGSAATLIQDLNGQCEALVRELVLLTDLQQQSGGCECGTKKRRLNGHTELLNSIQTDHPISHEIDRMVFRDSKIMDHLSSFLDPLSIVRCMRVSKGWKNWGARDELWHNLAIHRFGVFHFRQWQAKLEDKEEGIPPPSSTALYKTMDALNVMPYKKFDGHMTLLGEARLPGKVSAWCFMVERSNGETLRSVERPPDVPGTGSYASLPVVQLWIVLQNTGIHDESIVVKEQTIAVDASTRRRGEELKEIEWDSRFHKRVLNLDGSVYKACDSRHGEQTYREMCRLGLFDSLVLEVNIYAKGCTTTSKFVQRSNFTKVLVQIRDGTTIPLVIPFPRDAAHLLI